MQPPRIDMETSVTGSTAKFTVGSRKNHLVFMDGYPILTNDTDIVLSDRNLHMLPYAAMGNQDQRKKVSAYSQGLVPQGQAGGTRFLFRVVG